MFDKVGKREFSPEEMEALRTNMAAGVSRGRLEAGSVRVDKMDGKISQEEAEKNAALRKLVKKRNDQVFKDFGPEGHLAHRRLDPNVLIQNHPDFDNGTPHSLAGQSDGAAIALSQILSVKKALAYLRFKQDEGLPVFANLDYHKVEYNG